jgi:hypothetical protein
VLVAVRAHCCTRCCIGSHLVSLVGPGELRITRVFSCVAREVKLVLPLCSLGAAGGHCWLMMTVRGHLGGTERTGAP